MEREGRGGEEGESRAHREKERDIGECTGESRAHREEERGKCTGESRAHTEEESAQERTEHAGKRRGREESALERRTLGRGE